MTSLAAKFVLLSIMMCSALGCESVYGEIVDVWRFMVLFETWPLRSPVKFTLWLGRREDMCLLRPQNQLSLTATI
jgi:hypothetical protein